MRVVLDTNVFISAVLFRGKASQLTHLWITKKIKLLISREISQEYLKVLAYPKFELTKKEILSIVQEQLVPYVENIKTHRKVNAVPNDPSDNKFLECALDGRADYLISGDAHLLDLGSYKDIPIITVSSFFDTHQYF